MEIKIIPGVFVVSQVNDITEVPLQDEFCFLSKTDEEISVVCLEGRLSHTLASEGGWRMLRIQGVLDFSLVGILSKIAKILADASISIFTVSTYNTDYVLVKEEKLNLAIKVLSGEGYNVIE